MSLSTDAASEGVDADGLRPLRRRPPSSARHAYSFRPSSEASRGSRSSTRSRALPIPPRISGVGDERGGSAEGSSSARAGAGKSGAARPATFCKYSSSVAAVCEHSDGAGKCATRRTGSAEDASALAAQSDQHDERVSRARRVQRLDSTRAAGDEHARHESAAAPPRQALAVASCHVHVLVDQRGVQGAGVRATVELDGAFQRGARQTARGQDMRDATGAGKVDCVQPKCSGYCSNGALERCARLWRAGRRAAIETYRACSCRSLINRHLVCDAGHDLRACWCSAGTGRHRAARRPRLHHTERAASRAACASEVFVPGQVGRQRAVQLCKACKSSISAEGLLYSRDTHSG
jgi:hypothetical protein